MVAGVDDLIKQIGGRGDHRINIRPRRCRAATGGAVVVELCGGTAGGSRSADRREVRERCAEHDGVAGMDCGMSDIFREHGFPQPVGSHENEIPRLGNEVERQGAFDGRAVDFGGPIPIRKSAIGLKRPKCVNQGEDVAGENGSERSRISVRASSSQQELRGPTGFGGAGNQVVKSRGGGLQGRVGSIGCKDQFLFRFESSS